MNKKADFSYEIEVMEKALKGVWIPVERPLTIQERRAYVMKYCKLDFPKEWCSLSRSSHINLEMVF